MYACVQFVKYIAREFCKQSCPSYLKQNCFVVERRQVINCITVQEHIYYCVIDCLLLVISIIFISLFCSHSYLYILSDVFFTLDGYAYVFLRQQINMCESFHLFQFVIFIPCTLTNLNLQERKRKTTISIFSALNSIFNNQTFLFNDKDLEH